MAATNVQAFPGDVTISSNLVVDTNTLFVDSVGNKVGIGTTGPGEKLEVVEGSSIKLSGNYNNATAKLYIDRVGDATWSTSGDYDAFRFFETRNTSASEHFNAVKIGASGIAIGYDPPLYARGGVDSLICSGNVGIGTTNPRNILEVRGGDGTESDTHATFGKAVADSAGWSGIRLGTPYAAAHDAYCSVIESYNDPTSNYASILRFKTSLGDNAVATEHMRIQSNGNVGIGTDAPTRKLHVSGDGQTATGGVIHAHLDETGGAPYESNAFSMNMGGYSHSIRMDLNTLSLNAYGDAGRYGTMKFVVGDGSGSGSGQLDAMTIGSGGSVGIGTAAPGHKLDLLTYTANDGIRVQAGSKFALLTSNLTSSAYNGIVGLGDGGIIFSSDNDASSVSTTKGFVIAPWSTSGPSGLKIIENGKVGIGVASPVAFLDVAGSSTSGKSLQLRSGDSSSETDSSQIIFSFNGNPYNTDGYAHSIRTRHNAGSDAGNAIDFWLWNDTDTTDENTLGNKRVMTIDGTGKVGIGTDAPTGQLEVKGAGQTATATFNQVGNLGGTLALRDSGTSSGNGGAIMFGAGQGFWAAIKGNIIDGTTNTIGDLSFFTRNAIADATMTSRMTITDNGYIGIGTNAPTVLLDVAEQHGDIDAPIVVFRVNRDGASNGDGNVLRVENAGARIDAELYDATSNSVRQFSVKANGRCEAREIDVCTLTAAAFLGGDGGDSDGIFSRPDGQAYISVDDNFYFRDNESTTANRRGLMDTSNGNFKVTGGFTSSASLDYSEYFEWYDGNPDNEDRIGYSVSLFPGTDMIKKCEEGETPIGIVSGTSGFTGGGADIYWKGYWEQDAWGRPLYAQQLIHGEPVFNEDGTPKMKRVVNPDWDSTSMDTYIPRKDRKEWACVGLLGQVLMRPECVHSPFWTKMKSVDSEKDLWLISLFPSINKDLENDLEVEKSKTTSLETQLASVLARLDALESA